MDFVPEFKRTNRDKADWLSLANTDNQAHDCWIRRSAIVAVSETPTKGRFYVQLSDGSKLFVTGTDLVQ